jgi:hypothetical protein
MTVRSESCPCSCNRWLAAASGPAFPRAHDRIPSGRHDGAGKPRHRRTGTPSLHEALDLHQWRLPRVRYAHSCSGDGVFGGICRRRDRGPGTFRSVATGASISTSLDRTTGMESFALWLGQTSASAFVQKTLWLIPVLQTIHILSVAMVWSSVGMIELRILGVTRSQTMAPRKARLPGCKITVRRARFGAGSQTDDAFCLRAY